MWGNPPKHVVWLTFGGLALWMLVVTTGTRLPYLYTQFASNLRSFVLFPSLLGLLVYCIFFHKRPGQKVTLYVMRMRTFRTTKERIKENAWLAFGSLLICGTLAWTSVAFTAWGAQLFASERQEGAYQIEEITVRSGPSSRALFDLTLVDPTSGHTVVLRLTRSRYERGQWRERDRICITGRTGLFGTIIDHEVRCP